jgi:hypothetical protein
VRSEDLVRHNEEVCPILIVEHLKRVLMEVCLPENIKEKIRYKRTIE